MGLFGQYANVYSTVQETIYDRTARKNTELVSGLKPWIRISSAVHQGLILGTGISLDESFTNLYGTDRTSGKIGDNFSGGTVSETSTAFARGYRPSPIIESVGIENGSEGLTRKLTFQIKCFSLPQLDIITKYFLEPRFYLLAEWGWNTTDAYSEMAKIQNTTLENAVCEMIQYMNLGVLKKKRSDSKGHYDAFLGVITGGGIDFGDDETYIVNVEVMTQGEIPAYLQQHKGKPELISAITGSASKSSLMFDIRTEIETAQNSPERLGEALFMYMFNDLPSQKQIKSVKDLQYKTTKQVSDSGIKVDSVLLAAAPDSLYWCQEWQYLNMNTTYRDKLREILKDSADLTLSDGSAAVFNSEQPLISDSRYIRMELAWKILNEIGTNDVIREVYKCGDTEVKVPNHTISIDNTIIRAHKHMFSMNREFLFIPNSILPDFGLESIFKNATSGTSTTGFLQMENGQIKTRDATMFGSPVTYQFPRGLTLQEANVELGEQYDESYRLVNKTPHSWGYLKDLYVNFDFFVECLNRNGYLIKDIALDILNGLSQGCNMFWDFQIVEIGSTNPKDSGIQKLVVVDANFTGMPSGGKLIDGTDSQKRIFQLQTIGVNSPLLDINMKLEVKGAIANQVMMQRGDLLTNDGEGITKSSAAIEDKVEDFSGLFSDGLTDNLTAKIIEIQNTAGPDSGGGGSSSSTVLTPVIERDDDGNVIKITYGAEVFENERIIEAGPGGSGDFVTRYVYAEDLYEAFRAQEASAAVEAETQSNWVMFMQKAAVFPRENDPTLTDFFGPTGFWSNIFDLTYNNTTLDQLIVGVWEDSQLLRQIYEYDMIDPNNSLDRRFEPRTNPGYLPIEVTFTLHGVSGFKVGDMIHFTDLPHVYRQKIFTVMNVTQVIDGDIWKTTVTTACRNLPAPGSSPAGIPSPPSPTPNPFPGNTEGQGTPPPAPSPGQITETGNYWPPGQEPDWSR
jgi:hypothetical protein